MEKHIFLLCRKLNTLIIGFYFMTFKWYLMRKFSNGGKEQVHLLRIINRE